MTITTCTIEGCDRPRFARVWCQRHWARWWRHGDPLVTTRRPPGEPCPRCAVVGCRRPVRSNRLCHAHDQRRARNGDPRPAIPIGHSRAPTRRWPALAIEPHVDSLTALARLLGMARRDRARWERVRLTTAQADAAAIALGLHPIDVWGDTWIGAA